MENGFVRREFLARSLALAATPLLGKAAVPKASSQPIHRTLGRTGLSLPIVSMGVMNADLPAVVRRAYEVGMRHFDTASGYRQGRNEEMLGSVIKDLGVRDKVVIATKGLVPEHRRGLTAAQAKARFISILEGSLKRLQMDYVDMLYLHAALNAEDVRNEGALEALAQLKKDGKVRFTGLSPHDKIVEVIQETTRLGAYDVILVTINFTMKDDRPLLDAIAQAAAKGIGIIAMKTQAGGRMKPEDQARLPLCSQTALLKWVLRNPAITTAVPGFTTFDHLEQDWSVVYDLEYTKPEQDFLADKTWITQVQFCRQCSECLPSCPRNAEIPSLMRSCMYAVRYGNESHARDTLAGILPGRGLDACRDCTVCTARCRNTVNIPRNIAHLRAFADA
jgi:predicted aldo/keto reductase-like oxidoreductase